MPEPQTATSTVHTIGFTEKPAERFFELLRGSGVRRVIDVRLNPDGSLGGFSRRAHLPYLLREILGIDYIHEPLLAPEPGPFRAYQDGQMDWDQYQKVFLELMKTREIEKRVDPEAVNGGCLLCSEHKPHHCHRRLVAEYLASHWGSLDVRHLE